MATHAPVSQPSPLDLFTADAAPGVKCLDLHVPAIHCAGCIRKVEGAVRALPGVTGARVNFTTRRLAVEWETARLDPASIIETLASNGFESRPFNAADAAAGKEDPASRALIKALAVSGFAAMNVMLLSVSVWSGADGATRDLFHLISAVIAIPAIAYSARPFFVSALGVLRHGRTNMDVPISIGILLATLMSFVEMLRGADHVWFDAAITLTFFLLVGRTLDSLMRDRARAGVAQLLKQSARGALTLAPDGSTEYRAIESVAPNMRVLVAAGERLPVDGIVESGSSSIDRSLITGESLPEPVKPGAHVLAGTLNLDAPLTIRTTAVGEGSFLADIIRLMEAAEGGRARYVRIADRAARLYAPAVHLAALFTALFWLASGAGWHQSLVIAIAVLIITCPCALGLAVPAVQVTAAGMLLRRGILVKDGSALERLAEVDSIIFDKTGTLTMGRPLPVGALPLSPEDLRLALALALRSTHPLSRALAAAARAAGATAASVGPIREVPGLGLEADHEGELVRLGRPDWAGSTESAAADTSLLQLAFRKGNAPATLIHFADPLRPGAEAAIRTLISRGYQLRILSGDRPEAVAHVAGQLGITHWLAACSPADKVAAVAALKAEGLKPLVVGDGLNDAPALAAGHASIAPSSASDAGQTAADLLFLGDSLEAVPAALRVAAKTDTHVKQNFILAIGYNLLAVPIAMAGLATPLIAAVAMSSSSIIVVANALRLRWSAR